MRKRKKKRSRDGGEVGGEKKEGEGEEEKGH